MDIFDKPTTPAPSTEERLAAVERKLDAIIAHFGIGAAPRDAVATGQAGAPPAPRGVPAVYAPLDPRGMPTVVEWIRRGKLINAIKAYRDQTGAGLKEAKGAVDDLARELRYRHG